MKLFFIKSQGGVLIPADSECIDNMQKVKNGDTIMIEYKPKRNYQFHKKAFALLNLVLQNQDHYKTVENILEVVKFRAGYFETIITHTGKKHYKTKSISFSEMDNLEFEEFYSKIIDVAFELTGLLKKDIEKEILSFM